MARNRNAEWPIESEAQIAEPTQETAVFQISLKGADAFVTTRFNHRTGEEEKILRVELPGRPLDFRVIGEVIEKETGLSSMEVEALIENHIARPMLTALFVKALGDRVL